MPNIRPVEPNDLPTIVDMNTRAVPHVNALSLEDFEPYLSMPGTFLVAESSGSIVGFVIALDETANYDSPNFTWFTERRERFTYVDRIVVAESARGLGAGSTLYGAVFEHARHVGSPIVTCEVNVRPPNDRSMRFHEKHGFAIVGEQDTTGGQKRVALMEARV